MIILYKQNVWEAFAEIWVKKGPNISKKMAKNVLSNPGRAFDLTAKVAKAVVF